MASISDCSYYLPNLFLRCLYYFEYSKFKEEGIVFVISNKFGREDVLTYPFTTNRLLLFPGLLEHSVKYKKTDGVRKSISFNFKLEYF